MWGSSGRRRTASAVLASALLCSGLVTAGAPPAAADTEPAAVGETGVLDTTWSGDGWAPFPSRYSIALGPYSPNRIYSASYKASDGNGPMRISKFETSGVKATGWGGTNGYVLRSFSVASGLSFPTHVTATDTKVIVAGESYTTNARLGLARLRVDGTYDPAFSGDGRVLYKVFSAEHDVVSPFRVDVLPDGRIGIALAAFDEDAQGNFQFVSQAMVRLTAGGAPDTTFSGDGKAIVPNDWSDIRYLPNGGAFVGRKVGSTHEVRKLLPSGQLDPSFSGDGIAMAACGTHRGANLAIDPTGRPVLMCVKETLPTITLALFRFTTSGALDATYSGDGKATMVLTGAATQDWTVHFDQSANPWAAIRDSSNSKVFRVYTLAADGQPDPNWSGDGVSTVTLPFAIDLAGIEKSGDRLYVTTYKDATNVAIIALTAA